MEVNLVGLYLTYQAYGVQCTSLPTQKKSVALIQEIIICIKK